VLRNVSDDSVAQVFTEDGRVLSASANIQGQPPIVSATTSPNGGARTIRAPDDTEIETYRVWVQGGRGPEGPVTVVEGTSLESVQEATSTLRRALVVGVPLALLALCWVMWLVLGRALARLDRIRAEVDAVGPDQLDRRLPDDGRRDEVGRLVTTMNRMLSRVDSSVQRQRRFVADASHDLQGPLTAQRLSLELALGSPEAVDKDILRDDVLGATGQMEHLVGDLLALASVDEGARAPTVPVDLDGIVLEEAMRSGGAGSVVIDTSQVSAGPVQGNPGELRRIVRNLLDNAVRHARSRVELHVYVGGGRVSVDVADDGPGVPEAERELIFQRFHRGDPARTRGAAGHGLGLAIARSLAQRAGGTVELVGVGGPGAVFRLSLPVL
jgi:signal transduction histidine kinase